MLFIVLLNFPNILRPFGENSSRIEGKIGFRCKNIRNWGVTWHQNVNFSEKMGLWVTEHNFLKKCVGPWERL